MQQYDIVVVGAGTAGCYYAKRMAEQGFKTLVIDSLPEDRLGEKLDIFHMDKCFFDRMGIPQPKSGDDDYVSEFAYSMCESAYGHYPKKTDYPFIVMHFKPFLSRLRALSREKGVAFEFSTEFRDFVFNDKNKICGVQVLKDCTFEEISCRLVVDCSGIASTVRTKLPDSYALDNKPLGNDDMYYVVLRYVHLANPKHDKVALSTTYPYYKTWIAPQGDSDGAIIGVGAHDSYENADKAFADFESTIKLPEYELERIEKGTTPYRHAPYSLVSDGFLCLGDAAAVTKPYSGEGITAAWVMCEVAADESAYALADGAYPTRSRLWNVNVQYMRTQGADFASIMALLSAFDTCTKDENEYQFKHSIAFDEKLMREMNVTFANKMSVSQSVLLVWRILIGVLTRNLRPLTLKRLVKAALAASALKSHYQNYPRNPVRLVAWSIRADELWKRSRSLEHAVDNTKL